MRACHVQASLARTESELAMAAARVVGLESQLSLADEQFCDEERAREKANKLPPRPKEEAELPASIELGSWTMVGKPAPEKQLEAARSSGDRCTEEEKQLTSARKKKRAPLPSFLADYTG